MRAGDLDHRLPAAGRTGGADLAVDIEAGPNQRRVADSAGNLEEQARGGRGASEDALSVDRAQVDGAGRPDGAVLLDEPPNVRVLDLLRGCHPVVDRGHLPFPIEPDLARARGQEVFGRKADRPRKAGGAFADQQHARRAAHHREGHPGRMLESLEGADGARAHCWTVHAAGVELDHALGIGQAAVADRDVVWVGFDDPHTFHRRLDRIKPRLHALHGSTHRLEAVLRGHCDRPATGVAAVGCLR